MAVLAALPGCGREEYSESMVYPVRADPLITETSNRELPEPDQPGQLPLFLIKERDDARNPFHNDNALKYVDPAKLKVEDREELHEALQEVFGTPAHPKVELITSETRRFLQLDEETLKQGSRLYRLHCLQCHGLTGDGRGPTAKWVNPHPRDYRKGLFKFQSVDQVGKEGSATGDTVRPPSRDDLYRTIYEGVEGTAMQSYNMLPAHEINALVSYVIHLSIRGEVEEEVFKKAVNEEGKPLEFRTRDLKAASITGFIKGKRSSGGAVRDVADKWREAQDPEIKIKPGAYSIAEGDAKAVHESIQRGYEIFNNRGPVQGGCLTCHIDYGRRGLFKFDQWGTLVRPRDLTKPVYRGGRRPVDFYYRVHSGINGSGMLKQGKNLTPDQIWDLVNFVRALPYPEMRKHVVPPIE